MCHICAHHLIHSFSTTAYYFASLLIYIALICSLLIRFLTTFVLPFAAQFCRCSQPVDYIFISPPYQADAAILYLLILWYYIVRPCSSLD